MVEHATVLEMLGSARANREGVDGLLRYYRPALKLIAEQLVGNKLRRREDASDIVQRTLLEAHQGFETFRGATEAEFSAWIKQILRRNAATLGRDQIAAKRDVRRERYVDAADNSVAISWYGPAANSSSPRTLAIRAEDALKLAHAIESLPTEQQLAVTMRYLHGAGVSEIAAVMGKTNAAVAGLLRRGLEELRLTLK